MEFLVGGWVWKAAKKICNWKEDINYYVSCIFEMV